VRREEVGAALLQHRGAHPDGPFGVAFFEEVAPDVPQAVPEIRVHFGGIAFQWIDQIRTVGLLEGQRLGSPGDGLPSRLLGRRSRGAGEARRQQDDQNWNRK